jgi:hydroxymethylglutaryl-CoA lyase
MVEICEVGPRDGLQNEKVILSVAERVEMISKLINSGIRYIEAVSFVNSKVVPQMAFAERVMEQVPRRKDVRYAGLVLSSGGMERALASGLDDINVAIAASNTFNFKNSRRSTEDSLAEMTPIIYKAKGKKQNVTGVIGTAFGCPFEGSISFSYIRFIINTFLENGVDAITLADTTGMANPKQVFQTVEQFKEHFPKVKLGLHFHNTRGLGIVNVYAGYQAGVRRFDASIGGIGGCPFAPLSVGNVCTEDIVHMFEQMGETTGLDLDQLIQIAKWTEGKVEHPLNGYVMKAGPVERRIS